MEGEFNNLSTDNLATNFTNSPNNLELSDELAADPIYTRKMGTAYSAGKWAKRAVVITGITLTVTATAILGGNVIRNAYVNNPPKLVDGYQFVITEDNTLDYQFTIADNQNNYAVKFIVYQKSNERLFYLDCSTPQEYRGTIEELPINKHITYQIYFTNRFDYQKNLIAKTIWTAKE